MGASLSIVNIASVSGLRANRGRLAYGAAKAGVKLMSRGAGARIRSAAACASIALRRGRSKRRWWRRCTRRISARLAGPHAAGPLRRAGGSGRGGRLPAVAGGELHQRPHAASMAALAWHRPGSCSMNPPAWHPARSDSIVEQSRPGRSAARRPRRKRAPRRRRCGRCGGKAVLDIGDIDAAGVSRAPPSRRSRRCRWSRAARRTPMASATSELALACASHAGEPAHVDAGERDAGAGPGWTSSRSNAARIGRRTRRRRSRWRAPAASRRRCTTTARASIPASCAPAAHLGIDHRGYVDAGHPSQELVREAMEEVTGAAHGDGNRASTAARSRPMPCRSEPGARLCADGDRRGLSADRARAARRLFAACMAEPFYRCRHAAAPIHG